MSSGENMGEVVTYKNTREQCYCQIKYSDNKRILISIAGSPTPNIKIFKLGFMGLFPTGVLWEIDSKNYPDIEEYLVKTAEIFEVDTSDDSKHPLELFRDKLLPFNKIDEVKEYFKVRDSHTNEIIELTEVGLLICSNCNRNLYVNHRRFDPNQYLLKCSVCNKLIHKNNVDKIEVKSIPKKDLLKYEIAEICRPMKKSK